MADILRIPENTPRSQHSHPNITTDSKELDKPKIVSNENLIRKRKRSSSRKNKVRANFDSKSSLNSMEDIDGQISEVAENQNKLQEISKNTKNRKKKNLCQVCEVQIQTDPYDDDDNDDDDKINRIFIKFFNGLMLSGFILFILMIIHSEFILSKTVAKILSEKEQITDGIIEKISDPIMQIVNLGLYCIEQIINRI